MYKCPYSLFLLLSPSSFPFLHFFTHTTLFSPHTSGRLFYVAHKSQCHDLQEELQQNHNMSNLMSLIFLSKQAKHTFKNIFLDSFAITEKARRHNFPLLFLSPFAGYLLTLSLLNSVKSSYVHNHSLFECHSCYHIF